MQSDTLSTTLKFLLLLLPSIISIKIILKSQLNHKIEWKI